MPSTVIDIRGYTPQPEDQILFDNNIWMFLFCPLGNYRGDKQAAYSAFFDQCLSNGTSMLICNLILSEFSNAYLKLDFNQWKNREGNLEDQFKRHYQRTEDYTNTANEISRQLTRILSLSRKIDADFTNIDIKKINQRLDTIDFNDSYYLELADSKSLKILTDDRDFTKDVGQACDILTLTGR